MGVGARHTFAQGGVESRTGGRGLVRFLPDPMPFSPSFSLRILRRVAGLEAMPQPPLLRIEWPVVLMHGFGMLAGVKRSGHLHDEALWLRLHGVRAYAPNVSPYQTIAARASMWAERLDAVLAETGAARVHLVAHSMGGLDARYLVSAMGWHDRVATLTTVATPHHGTVLAEFAFDPPTPLPATAAALARRAAGLVDWAGAGVLDGGGSNVLAALAELTREGVCERFNPVVPDHPDVVYRSYAGHAGKGTNVPISAALRVQNALIHAREGENDGIVSVESARWSGYQGTIDADHMAQIGLLGGRGAGFRAHDFYLDVARMLATDEAHEHPPCP